MTTYNFPSQSTSFVGRAQELNELASLVRGTRLATLTGPGGAGKTRLVCATGERTADAYPDGAWFVDLAPVTDAALVDAVIASALGVTPGPDGRGSMIGALAGSERLVVLDNCEHLLSACADVVADLLEGCPYLTIVATSREALGVAGEVVWSIPTMRAPSRSDDLDTLKTYDAVTLFTERAMHVDRRFELTPTNAGGIVRIIERLDGVPLAIELAATWTRVLSPEEIATKLDDRFRLLNRGPSDAPERHRTLRAAIDWSYELLNEANRGAFGALSVFRGGFTFEAADAVCADDVDLLDALHALVEGSLVVADTSGEESRYSMLETIREYGDDTLSDERKRVLRDRHLAWFASFAERANVGFGNEGGEQWHQRFDDDDDNIRQALGWSLAEGSLVDGLELANAASGYWFLRSRLVEGRSWLTQLVDAARTRRTDDDRFTTALASVLHESGRMSIGIGDLASAQTSMEAAAALVERVEPTPRTQKLLASVIDGLAQLAIKHGNLDDARANCERSIEILRAVGERLSEGRALTVLGEIRARQGDLDAGRSLIEQGMDISREVGDHVMVAQATITLGNVLLGAGALIDARRTFEQALALCRDVDAPSGVAYAWHSLGTIAAADGDFERAISLTERALEQYVEVGLGDNAAVNALTAGSYAQRAGAPGRAAAAYVRALDLGAEHVGPWALEGLAEVAATSGRVADAGLMLGAAAIVRETNGPPAASDDLETIDRAMTLARSAGEEVFEESLAAGRVTSFVEAIDAGRAIAAELSEAPVAAAGAPSFTLEGEVWVVRYEGRTTRVRDSKGMRHIAALVSSPGREIHVLDLVAGPGGRSQLERADDAPEALAGRDAEDLLDAEARASYEGRLRELSDEIEEAEGFNDDARATRLRAEFDALVDELQRTTGLGGRSRKAASEAERERLNVQRTIKAAVKRVFDADRALGRHLDEAIKTGTYCSYVPS